ncbi:hypothetical protein [Dokdonia sp. Hel_I_53]|uniref:hypothetical protein n=1 Tax=Dokdonia sp. Hel_I_53 TaxID=1566287 RepID=UPI00119C3ED5|nr:hypothetical protein [Dokdonia sp. Hel_I_53]TVZ52333.1 hypothetical protein OD90_1506 [Dokdonia sp. Hel_I_53]
MRRVLLLFLAVFLTISCKNDAASSVYEGEFIFLTDAAVLKGDTYIYGVTLDEKMHELATIIKPLQRDEFDMVPVIVKATVKAKEEGTEGWDSIVTIKEIIEVKAPKGDTPLRLKAGDRLNAGDVPIEVESDTLSQN